MEREQSEQDPQNIGFEVDLGGTKFRMTPENTGAFLHEYEPQFDHLFYTDNGGYLYLFRQKIDDFDAVVEFMRDRDYQIEEAESATVQDREQYFELYGYPEIPKRELTRREERKIAFAHYLLEREHVAPESFA